jgi:hypothetical protein
VGRAEPGVFSPKQVALLQTFADQAVIAIENVRLFNETKEALDQQTATAEILRIIAASPTDIQPVFDAIVETAVRLCGALNGFIWRVEDGLRRQVSYAGVMSPAAWSRRSRSPTASVSTIGGGVYLANPFL